MSFLRRLFGGRKPAAPAPSGPDADTRLGDLLRRLREKLHAFLVTRTAEPGVLKETPHFRLSKTNDNLFRLEAEGVSILVHTEPFLLKKDGKIQGLLRMSEISLCRALSGGGPKMDLGSFLEHADPPGERSRGLFAELRKSSYKSAGGAGQDARKSSYNSDGDLDGADPDVLPALSELLTWRPFDADQMIAQNDLNTLGHVLIHATPELEVFLRNRLSRRLKLMLVEELERIGSPGSRPELNPNSRNRGLLHFEEALLEFRRKMHTYVLRERGRELQRERRREKTRFTPAAAE